MYMHMSPYMYMYISPYMYMYMYVYGDMYPYMYMYMFNFPRSEVKEVENDVLYHWIKSERILWENNYLT